MPENKSENAIIPDGIIPDGIIPDGEAVPKAAGAETAQAGNAWVEFERGRVSRRQALKKFGMTSAMATFALFSVDDLARMVGKAMQQRAADNKVVEQIAKEFQNAGVVMADGTGGTPSSCQHCANQLFLDECYCVYAYDVNGTNPNPTMYQHCKNQASYNYSGCCNTWCPSGTQVKNNNGPTCPPYSSQQPPQGCGC